MSTFAGSKGSFTSNLILWTALPMISSCCFSSSHLAAWSTAFCLGACRPIPSPSGIFLCSCQTGQCQSAGEQQSLTSITRPESAGQGRDIGEVRSRVAQTYWSHSDVSSTPVHMLMVSWQEKAGVLSLSSCHWLLCPEGQAEGKQPLLAKGRVHSSGELLSEEKLSDPQCSLCW